MGLAYRCRAGRHNLDGAIERESVTPLVQRDEPPRDGIAVLAGSKGHVEFVPLPGVPHAGMGGHASGFHVAAGARAELQMQFRDVGLVHGGRLPHDARRGLTPLRRNSEPKRTQNARVRWNQDAVHAQQIGESAAVQRPTATKRHEHALPRIDAAFNAYASQRTRHGGIGNGDYGLRRSLRRDAHALGKGGNRSVRSGAIEHDAPGEFCRVEPAKHDVRVRHRGFCAATPKRHRSRHGASTLWPDAKRTAVVHPRDASTTGAHRLDKHTRERDRNASHASAGFDQRFTVEDQSGIRTGAANIDRQGVAQPRRAQHGGRAHHATGRARESQRRGAR